MHGPRGVFAAALGGPLPGAGLASKGSSTLPGDGSFVRSLKHQANRSSVEGCWAGLGENRRWINPWTGDRSGNKRPAARDHRPEWTALDWSVRRRRRLNQIQGPKGSEFLLRRFPQGSKKEGWCTAHTTLLQFKGVRGVRTTILYTILGQRLAVAGCLLSSTGILSSICGAIEAQQPEILWIHHSPKPSEARMGVSPFKNTSKHLVP